MHAHRFYQVVVDQHRCYWQALALPAHLRDVAPPQEAAQDAGRLHDAGQFLHLGQKGRLLARRLAASIKAEHVGFVVAQRLALHKRQLRVDDHHGHDEQHRERELQHDQALPRPHVAGPGRQLAFQHGRRLEPRQVERGVAARQQPRTQRQGQAGPHQRRLPTQGQRLARQRAELREHELYQPHGHDQGQQGHHHGFRQVLPHQRGSARPQGLANAHFLYPPRGLGGEQVHEIDAGNHQNEPGNQGEQSHVGNAPPGGDAVFVGAVQVRRRERPHKQRAPLGLGLRAFSFQQTRQLGLKLRGVGALLQGQVGVEGAVVVPLDGLAHLHLVLERGKRQHAVKLLGRVAGHPGKHPGHQAGLLSIGHLPFHGFAQAVLRRPKELGGQGFGEDNGVFVPQHRGGGAHQQGVGKQLEEGRVRVFGDGSELLAARRQRERGEKRDRRGGGHEFNLRHFPPQGLGQQRHGAGLGLDAGGRAAVFQHLIQPAIQGVVAVEAALVAYPQVDEQRAGQAGREAN